MSAQPMPGEEPERGTAMEEFGAETVVASVEMAEDVRAEKQVVDTVGCPRA